MAITSISVICFPAALGTYSLFGGLDVFSLYNFLQVGMVMKNQLVTWLHCSLGK